MVAVEDLDIDGRLGHAPRHTPELPRRLLIQSHGNDLTIRHYRNPHVGQRSTCSINVGHQKMSQTARGGCKRTAPFETHACSA